MKSNHTSDLQARRIIQACSIDCHVVKRRLLYFVRIVVNAPPTLLALLALRPQGSPLPWITALTKDLVTLYDNSPRIRSQLPHPLADESQPLWHTFIKYSTQLFKQCVHDLFWDTSVLDSNNTVHPNTPAHESFICTTCPGRPAFFSDKALKQHQRIKHGVTNIMKYYVHCTSCPVCRRFFVTRLRCIAHLSDKRRTKCSSNSQQCTK